MPQAPHPIIVAHSDPTVTEHLCRVVETSGPWQVKRVGGDRDALVAAIQIRPVAAVIECGLLRLLPPGTTACLIAVGEADHPADQRAARDAGAAGPLSWPADADTLTTILARIRNSPTGRAAGVVVAVAGVHGGAGTSTVAAYLAGAWARWGAGQVLLADVAGGLGFRLDLSPTAPTWRDLDEEGSTLDAAALLTRLATPYPGLAVLPRLGLADGATEPAPDPARLHTVVSAAEAYDTVVVDVPSTSLLDLVGHHHDRSTSNEAPAGTGTGRTTGRAAAPAVAPDRGTVAGADVLVLVSRPDSAGLTALETADAIRQAMAIPTNRTGLVVVGAGQGAPVGPREVRARLGDRLWALIPDTTAALAAAAEDGLLVLDRPELPAVQAMLGLAHRILPLTGMATVR